MINFVMGFVDNLSHVQQGIGYLTAQKKALDFL